MSQLLTGRRPAPAQAGIALPVALPWLLAAIAAVIAAILWWQHQRASDTWAAERERLSERREASAAALDEARAEAAQLRGRLDDLSDVQTRLDELRDNLQRQRVAAAELRSHVDDIDAVPERLEAAQLRITELESAAAAEQAARIARESADQQRLWRLQRRLDTLQRGHLRARDGQLEAALALHRGEQRIAEVDSRITEAQARVAAAEQRAADAQARASAAEQRHSELQEHTDTLFAENRRLSEEGDQLARQLDEILAERDSARQQIEELQQHLSEMSTELAETRRVQRAYSAELDDTRSRLQQASETAGQLDARLAELASQRETDRARFNALRERLEDQLGERGVTIETLRNRLTVITLQNDVLFPSGSAELTSTARRALDEIAGALREYPQRLIAVEGHTDSVPLRPGRAYPTNWELSAARAASAVRFLAGHDGIAPQRLQVVGHGKYRPVSDNDSAAGRKRNRRIEIRLLPEEGWLAKHADEVQQANAQ